MKLLITVVTIALTAIVNAVEVPVRLTNGDNQFEGRVEVYYNGQWGTVCDDNWDMVDANVVCQQLGFGGATNAYTNGYFGSENTSMPIWLNEVQCTTGDRYLSECGHAGWGNNSCSHFEDAGVACNETGCPEGYIRLVGGASIYEGRVEVCHNDEWGTVCDDSWNINDGIVACYQLGFPYVRVNTTAKFGQGTGQIWLANLSCIGFENQLFDCVHNGFGSHDCSHSEDAGLVCDAMVNAVEVPVRLTNGDNQFEGRVDVYYNGQWGTVCDDNWDIVDANAVCQQLGLGGAISAYRNGYFSSGNTSMPIWLNEVQCTTGDRYLSECGHAGWGNNSCSHFEDAGVACNETGCTEGYIRLVGGASIYEGRVEVCHNDEWGTVCDDSWSINDGIVACHQLGFPFVTVNTTAKFGQGTGQIWLDNLLCTGYENQLFDCVHNGFGSHNCFHSEDAGLVCDAIGNALEVPVHLANGDNQFEGRVEVYYNGQWGTVCDDNWDIVDANVVCQQLGFGGAISAYTKGYFGSGNSLMSIWLNEVQCTTRDRYLSECGHAGWGNNSCSHFEDAGVACTEKGCTEGYIRLVGGASIYEGRVEVCHNDEWGTVCDDNWSINDGIIACRQLGFPYVRVNTTAKFGQGTGQIWLDNLLCTGFENQLFDCIHNGFGSHDCVHSEDAGLVCDAMVNALEVPVRLTNGDNQFEGRVEVYYNGQWGTVCDDNWDIVDANVVCQQLGFGGAISAYTNNSFGSGNTSMPIWLDEIQCTTRDHYLSECGHAGWGNNNCFHFEDAGVTCTQTGCTEGYIRLVGGASIYEGRVEVCHNDEWGTVCDDSWSINDGIVACRQLGFPYVRVDTTAKFGQGTGQIWLDNLLCTRFENQLFDCVHNGFGSHDCSHSEDAGLICDVPVRLANGDTQFEGRVEVYYNGQWGTVCDDNWDIIDANVVCQQLGFSEAVRAYTSSWFGSGSSLMPIWLDDVQCATGDRYLSECGHNGWGNNNCSHSEDASVACTGTTCTEGSIRLVGGSSIYEGRVEVCHNGEWGTVCDDSWSTNDGIVACRQLGYSYTYSSVRVTQSASFGQGTGPIWLDNLLCTGSETRLIYCSHNGFGTHDCTHSEDAGLVCDFSIDYHDSTGSGSSVGATAGIIVGGILLFLFIGASLIVAIICLRRYHVRKQNYSCTVIQQPNQQKLMATAPSSSQLCAYNPTQLPAVHYTNPSTDDCASVTTPHHFPQSGYSSRPQSGYNPGPQPEYNLGPQLGYNSEPQLGYNPGPQPGYNPGPQPGYNPGPQPGYNPGPQLGYNPGPQPGYYISEPTN